MVLCDSCKEEDKKKLNSPFPITSVCRLDFVAEGLLTRESALRLTDNQMQKIASKMADDYVSQLFWEHLLHYSEIIKSQEDDVNE